MLDHTDLEDKMDDNPKTRSEKKGKGKDKPGHRQNVVVYEDVDAGFSFE
jgi:hypothetical protein